MIGVFSRDHVIFYGSFGEIVVVPHSFSTVLMCLLFTNMTRGRRVLIAHISLGFLKPRLF